MLRVELLIFTDIMSSPFQIILFVCGSFMCSKSHRAIYVIRPIFDIFQMYFHYKTTKCDDDRTVIDDSHKYDKPMEIILGKKFKLEVWETCLKTMLPNEVSEFLVDKLVCSCCSLHGTYFSIFFARLQDLSWKKKKRN